MSGRGDDHEKRNAPRKRYVHFAWYKRIDDAASDEEEGVGRSFDVSEGGAGMITTMALPVGARIFLELVTHAGRISVIGRVMHCTKVDEGYHRVGIRVDFVPPTGRAVWCGLGGDRE